MPGRETEVTMRGLCLLMMVLCAAGAGDAADNLLYNGAFNLGLEAWRINDRTGATVRVVDVDLDGPRNAVRVTLNPEEGTDSWALNLNQSVAYSIPEGHRLQIRAWMRSPDRCRVMPHLEVSRAPYTKSASETVTLTPQWREYVIEGAARQDFAPEEASLGFHLAYDAGTVEIADVRLYDLDAPPMPEGVRPTMHTPVSLIENGDFSQGAEAAWHGIDGERVAGEVVEADVGGFTQALRLALNPPAGAAPWHLQLGQAIDHPVRRGDAVYFRAWLRSPEHCTVAFIFEMAAEPHTKYISQRVSLTPDWREYRFMGRAGSNFRPGESQAKFFLGYDAGTVEIAGVRVENYGDAPDTAFDQTIDFWGGREPSDEWRAPALERIERIRRGDVTVRVLDAQGNPVPEAQVRVEQERHHFRFGTCAPASRFLVDSPDNLRFREEVERLYNVITFENDLKWPHYQRLDDVDRAIEWLRERDIEVRGHCLLWGSYRHLAAPVRDLRGEELLQACREHVAEYATRYRGKLYLWDVVNEAATNVEVWEEVGWDAFADSFRWAREADPEVLLCYNDYGIVNDHNPAHRATVAERIRYLLDREAPVDVLGIQGHMGLPLTPLDRVLEILDEWAAFGKRLEITEFDLGCPDDDMHAQYVRDFMIAAFSHPQVDAFIMWGFWEGSHWRSHQGAAMFRRDWSPRPAQEAWEDLVLNEWWTRWEGATDAEGAASLRAFHGRHAVTATLQDRTASAVIELAPDAPALVELRLQ